MFRLSSKLRSTVFFDCARPMFRLSSTYVSTVDLTGFELETYVLTELDLIFDCTRAQPKKFVRLSSIYVFRLSSTFVSTELDLCFD